MENLIIKISLTTIIISLFIAGILLMLGYVSLAGIFAFITVFVMVGFLMFIIWSFN